MTDDLIVMVECAACGRRGAWAVGRGRVVHRGVRPCRVSA